MHDAFSVRGQKFEPERPCAWCTCCERSNHFIEDMMNLVVLFTKLKCLELWLRQKRRSPCCACTCGKRPEHFIEDMNFETRQHCGTCLSSKQNKTRFTCQPLLMACTCLYWPLSSFLQRFTHIPEILSLGDFYPERSYGHVVPR